MKPRYFSERLPPFATFPPVWPGLDGWPTEPFKPSGPPPAPPGPPPPPPAPPSLYPPLHQPVYPPIYTPGPTCPFPPAVGPPCPPAQENSRPPPLYSSVSIPAVQFDPYGPSGQPSAQTSVPICEVRGPVVPNSHPFDQHGPYDPRGPAGPHWHPGPYNPDGPFNPPGGPQSHPGVPPVQAHAEISAPHVPPEPRPANTHWTGIPGAYVEDDIEPDPAMGPTSWTRGGYSRVVTETRGPIVMDDHRGPMMGPMMAQEQRPVVVAETRGPIMSQPQTPGSLGGPFGSQYQPPHPIGPVGGITLSTAPDRIDYLTYGWIPPGSQIAVSSRPIGHGQPTPPTSPSGWGQIPAPVSVPIPQPQPKPVWVQGPAGAPIQTTVPVPVPVHSPVPVPVPVHSPVPVPVYSPRPVMPGHHPYFGDSSWGPSSDHRFEQYLHDRYQARDRAVAEREMMARQNALELEMEERQDRVEMMQRQGELESHLRRRERFRAMLRDEALEFDRRQMEEMDRLDQMAQQHNQQQQHNRQQQQHNRQQQQQQQQPPQQQPPQQQQQQQGRVRFAAEPQVRVFGQNDQPGRPATGT